MYCIYKCFLNSFFVAQQTFNALWNKNIDREKVKKAKNIREYSVQNVTNSVENPKLNTYLMSWLLFESMFCADAEWNLNSRIHSDQIFKNDTNFNFVLMYSTKR